MPGELVGELSDGQDQDSEEDGGDQPVHLFTFFMSPNTASSDIHA
jgi:hypothetical protein